MAARRLKLIVEGEEDKFAIIELMGHHTEWPDDKRSAPVWIEVGGSYSEILAEGFITAKVRESGTEILGIVLDADQDFDGRWQRIRTICAEIFNVVPETIDGRGLILQEEDTGPRLGFWIMPDNHSHGMLETFLQELVRKDDGSLLDYTEAVVMEARTLGATWKDTHSDKARIHSLLAWLDPPGQALGRAITSRTLDPAAESGRPFIDWFLKLYDLPRLPE